MAIKIKINESWDRERTDIKEKVDRKQKKKDLKDKKPTSMHKKITLKKFYKKKLRYSDKISIYYWLENNK